VNLEAFQRERGPQWRELDGLLDRAGTRPERLGAEGVLELGRLYRASVADLALARRRFAGDPVLERLERLVLRARPVVYGERARRRGGLRAFVSRGYWRELRAHRATLAVALVAMFAPALLSAAWAVHDPGAAIGLMPAAYRSAADPHVRHLPTGAASQAGLASSIFTNNIQVTFLTFAGGLALGVGTVLVLAYNGLLLGTLAGLTIQAGTFSVFVRYVAPHGLLELSCISVAGAAGLGLGRALIEPGLLTRGESLRREARKAVALVLGTAPWLVLAGTVEGFVTPRDLPLGAALAVGVTLAAIFWSLALTRGRLLGADAKGVFRADAPGVPGLFTGAPAPSP
jgi:uncharacterized membrane protein SpoIIM required for sporulation